MLTSLPHNSAQNIPNPAGESIQKLTFNKTTTFHIMTVEIGLILEMVWSEIFPWYYGQQEKIMLHATDIKRILVADCGVTTNIRHI